MLNVAFAAKRNMPSFSEDHESMIGDELDSNNGPASMDYDGIFQFDQHVEEELLQGNGVWSWEVREYRPHSATVLDCSRGVNFLETREIPNNPSGLILEGDSNILPVVETFYSPSSGLNVRIKNNVKIIGRATVKVFINHQRLDMSSHIPKVQQKRSDFQSLSRHVNPDEGVVHGAVMHRANQMGEKTTYNEVEMDLLGPIH